MGHYDSIYEADDERIAKNNLRAEMTAKRKLINDIRILKNQILKAHYSAPTPDRFVWALEDFERWANEGLDEWEREHIVKKLKGK